MSQVFAFNSHQVRTVTQNNEPWFAAIDVCRALDISWSGSKILRGFPDAWKGVVKLTTPFGRRGGGNQKLIVISEPAVYKLAFRSNKPEADAFTNWVASEVLPAIRKGGEYKAAPRQRELPPAQEPKPAPIPEGRPLVYRNGMFYPMRKNRQHVAGPREKAIMDLWCFEYDRRAKELEDLFRKLLAAIDTAVGDTCCHAVAAIARDADTMFSISCLQEGFYATRDMAHESFKDALHQANLYLRMASAMATALNR